MNVRSHALVSMLVLSVLSTGILLSPQIWIPAVLAGEPAGDSASIMRCVGLLPSTPSCVSDFLQPFETIVDDADNDGVYDAAEVVIVGPTPTVGSALSNDGKILFRDTVSGTISPPRWQTGEFMFYDADGNNATITDRIPLIGTVSTSTTLVKKDFRTRFVDSSGDGVLTGIVRVTARLERLGGTQAEGTAEDVDGIQTVYTFDPTILKPMRASYPSGGVYPNPGQYKSAVRTHCTGSGGTFLDTVTADEAAGQIKTSHLCSQSPRTADVGLGCNPSITVGCPGDPATGGPLQNVDVVNINFLILHHGVFNMNQIRDQPGQTGSYINDVDGTTTRTLPLTLSGTIFDNRKPGAEVHDAAMTAITVKETGSPKTHSINVGIQNQGNVKQEISLRGTVTPQDLNGLGSIGPIQGNILQPNEMRTVQIPFSPNFDVTYNIVVEVFFKEPGKTDVDLSDNQMGTTFTRPRPKVGPTAVINAPNKEFVKVKVTYDGRGSFDNNVPPQPLVSYTWTNALGNQLGVGQTLNQTYMLPGVYTVRLTVCNESNLCDTASHAITINAVKANPTAVISAPSKLFVKQKVTYDGSVSFDNSNPRQGIVSYTWTDAFGTVIGIGPILSQTYSLPGVYTVTLMVCNDSGLCGSASQSVTVNAVKGNPTAVITGPTKAFNKEKTVFDGSGSFDNSNPLQGLTYSWTVDGVALTDKPSSISVTFFTTGPQTVTLTVCNTSGLCSTATHSITINPVKVAPTASVTGPTKAFIKANVTFDASASRDNSNPVQSLSYSWSVDVGASVLGGMMFTTAFFTTGNHTVTLTVCNESSLCSSASHTIVINAIKRNPTAVISAPGKVFVKEKVIFGSTVVENSNPRQNIVSLTWTIGGQVVGSGPVLSYTFFVPGLYAVTLTACNESNLCSSGSTTILINAVKNAPATVITGPTKAFVKEKVLLDGSGSFDSSNPLQQIVGYTWAVTPSTGFVINPTPAIRLSLTFSAPGTYTVSLTVCNESGLCGSTGHTITINPIKQVPTAIIAAPSKAFVKEKVLLDGSPSFDTSNPTQRIVSYRWTDPAGNVLGTGSTLSRTFFIPGVYNVALTVCNESGLCDAVSRAITINPIKAPPSPIIIAPGQQRLGYNITFDGGGSFDNSNPLQRIVSYTWNFGDGSPTQTRALEFHTYTTTGTYVVRLTVCNESGLCGSADHQIKILPVDADANGDGQVNQDDLDLIASLMGVVVDCRGGQPLTCHADVDDNQSLDNVDLEIARNLLGSAIPIPDPDADGDGDVDIDDLITVYLNQFTTVTPGTIQAHYDVDQDSDIDIDDLIGVFLRQFTPWPTTATLMQERTDSIGGQEAETAPIPSPHAASEPEGPQTPQAPHASTVVLPFLIVAIAATAAYNATLRTFGKVRSRHTAVHARPRSSWRG